MGTRDSCSCRRDHSGNYLSWFWSVRCTPLICLHIHQHLVKRPALRGRRYSTSQLCFYRVKANRSICPLSISLSQQQKEWMATVRIRGKGHERLLRTNEELHRWLIVSTHSLMIVQNLKIFKSTKEINNRTLPVADFPIQDSDFAFVKSYSLKVPVGCSPAAAQGTIALTCPS